MQYKDRREAGKKLADALTRYAEQDVVVYALARGGVPVGAEVATALGAPLEVLVIRKIGHPSQPEWAVCAVSDSGHLLCDEEERAGLDAEWLKETVETEKNVARMRRDKYLGKRQRRSARDKVAIIVDDGIATGLTMLLAVDELLREYPKEVVVAVPVAPEETAEKIRARGATLVALQIPDQYEGAVGAYYQEFPQIEDSEVAAILKKHETV